MIVVGFQIEGGSNTATTISGVTDNAGNAYSEGGSAKAIDTGAGTVIDIWYAKNSAPGATSVTITPSGSVNAGAVIWEFSGVDRTAPLDKTAVLNSQAATTAVSGASVAIASTSEVVISITEVATVVTGIASGNTFVNDSTLMSNGWAHLITSAPGTYSAQWTQSPAGTYDASTVSFKAASTAPTFTLSASPASQTVKPGTNGVYTVSVTPSGGFTGTISLSATGLPTGVTASFNPNSIITSGSATLTLTTAGSTPLANYPFTISGTSGSLIQTTPATLVVSSSTGPSACDLNKDGSVDVADVQVAADNSVSCSATVFQTFYSQVITGVLSSCPVTTGIHTVSLNWTASTTPGVSYNIYRATTSGGYNYAVPLNPTPISGTSFSDCSVTLNQTYYYVIRSVDGSGNQSANSSEVTVNIPAS